MHCFLGTLSFWKLRFSDSNWFEKGEKRKKKEKKEKKKGKVSGAFYVEAEA